VRYANLRIAVSAYLGAAPLISSSDILSSAASIMSIEARQSSFVNSVLGNNAFSSAFETPLSLEQVVNLVAPSIVSIPDDTILQVLGFDVNSFALEEISITAFAQVSISDSLSFGYSSGDQIVPPEGVSQLYCAYSLGLQTYYTNFDSQNGCGVSQNLEVGNVAVVQVTVSESIEISECLTAAQFITIV
jgi:Ferritin-like domain